MMRELKIILTKRRLDRCYLCYLKDEKKYSLSVGINRDDCSLNEIMRKGKKLEKGKDLFDGAKGEE